MGTKREDTREPHPSAQNEIEERERTFSRRGIIQAGWTVPVVMAVAPPRAIIDSRGHSDSDGHHDHWDTPPPGGPRGNG